MSKNEIVLKAKQLDNEHNCEAVIEMLKDYVNENKNDKEALALYQKNLAMKTICDMDVDIDEIMSTDETIIFRNVSENEVLNLAKLLFAESVANTYLCDEPTDKKDLIVRGYMRRGILSLGERLNDYDVFKNLLKEFYDIVSSYGFQNKFYTHLAYIVGWKSKVDENILHFIVESVKSKITTLTDKEIYDEYVKDMKTVVCSYEQKPEFYGDKLVIANIKTQEQADFWKGYFALVKKIRQEEYDTYKENSENKDSELYTLYNIGTLLHDIAINMALKKLITSTDIAKMGVATKYDMIGISESDYIYAKDRAEKSYNTVKVNPIEKIKSMIYKLLSKK